MIKAIVFDLDGTLHDQETGERLALEKLYRQDIQLDPTPGYAEFLRVWRNSADGLLSEVHKGRMDFDEQRVQRVIELHATYGKELSVEAARALSDQYVAYYEQEWRPYPDALLALGQLRGSYRLGIITNGEGRRQRGKIKKCGFEGSMESVIVSGEVGVSKPDKGIFELSRQAFGLQPEEMAYVGDRLETDALGARGAGWRGLWIDRKGMPGSGDPDTINGLLELTQKLS
jgi:putative hydrolase of the HAD superfamily